MYILQYCIERILIDTISVEGALLEYCSALVNNDNSST